MKKYFNWFWRNSTASVITPSISGNDVVGSVLTVSPSTGTIRWKRDGADIVGETASTYTSVTADANYGVEITVSVNGIESNPFEVVINPATITQRYYSADVAFKDTGKTTPAVDGEGVQAIEDQVADVDLDWIGTITGQAQIQSDFDYGDTDPYPKFHDKDGGFIQILNSTPQKLETGSISYAGQASMVYFVRLNGGTDNEYFFFVSNGGGMRDRDEGTGNSTQIGSFNTLTTLSSGGRVLTSHVYKTVMFELVRDGSGNLQLYVNGTAWGNNAVVGTNNMTEHAWGSNSHNATISMFASAIYTGARDATKVGQLQKLWEKKHGAVGSYPSDFPYVTFDSGGTYSDKETWNAGDNSINAAAYNFRSPTGKAEGATEFRLYGSTSATQATAIGTKFLVATKIKGVDANPGKFIKGTDYTTANVWYWIEVIGVDVDGGRQPFATSGGGLLSP